MSHFTEEQKSAARVRISQREARIYKPLEGRGYGSAEIRAMALVEAECELTEAVELLRQVGKEGHMFWEDLNAFLARNTAVSQPENSE